MLKRRIIGCTLGLIVALAGVGMVFSATDVMKPYLDRFSTIDDWVVRQVVDILETHIIPDIEFSSFSYIAPGTVRLEGVQLVAPDGTDIIDAGRLIVTLAEVPRRGRPVKIRSVAIENASLNLIQQNREDGVGFKGLFPFVEPGPIENPDSVPSDRRLSNVLQMRSIALRNVALVYDAGAGEPPMTLDGINLEMNIEPAADADEPGWYVFKTTLDRAPVFVLAVDGSLNLDTFAIRLAPLALAMDLREESYAALPPQAQSFLREHDVRGGASIKLTGDIPLTNPRDARANAILTLEDINVAAGQGRLPIDRGLIDISIGNRIVTIEPIDLTILGGALLADGSIDLTDSAAHADLNWRFDDIALVEALRTRSAEDEPPRIAGALNSTGGLRARLTDLPSSIAGRGEVRMRDGRLVNIPVVRALAGALNAVATLDRNAEVADRLDANFTLTGDSVRLDDFELISQVIAARGHGFIHYDGRLDILANAGPLEKMQGALGGIGKAIGSLTDSLMKYHIRGSVGDPSVTLRPLGIGARTGEQTDPPPTHEPTPEPTSDPTSESAPEPASEPPPKPDQDAPPSEEEEEEEESTPKESGASDETGRSTDAAERQQRIGK